MARGAREKSATGIYHIMMRGINRQNIFNDEADKERFLGIVNNAVTQELNLSGRPSGKYEVYAYALMGNHFHILVNVVSGELGEFVKKIAAGYVKYFNNKYSRDGHLFKERFKSQPCENYSYFCVVMGYIHQNPVKHGFSEKPDGYRYTSWNEYFDPDNALHKLCNVNYTLSRMTLDELKETIGEMHRPNLRCIDIDQPCGKIPDDTLTEHLFEKYGIDNPLEIKEMERGIRREIVKDLLGFGAAIRQISRLTGLDKMVISRLR